MSPRRTGGASLAGVRFLALASAVQVMSYGAVFALLADLQDAYALPEWSLGVLSSSTFVAALGAQLGLGRLSDRGHGALLLRVGLVTCTASMAWFALATELWQFIVARLLMGFGIGLYLPAFRRLVVNRAPHAAGELLGKLGAIDVTGFILGPPLAALLASTFGLKVPFALQAAVLAVCLGSLRRAGTLSSPVAAAPAPPARARDLLRLPALRLGMLVSATVFFVVGAFDTVWARILRDAGATTGFVGISLAVAAIPSVVLAGYGGRTADRVGPGRVARRGLVLLVPVLALYATTSSVAFLTGVAVLQACVDAFLAPAGSSLVARAAPQHMGASQGLVGAAATGTGAVSGLVGGWLYASGGPVAVWSVLACVVAAVSLVAHRLAGALERDGASWRGDPVTAAEG